MHFAGIDVPQELVTAHAEGDVVFFVGAGASVPAPTSLPGFRELTTQVAERLSEEPPTDEDLKEPDLYLGRLDADPRVDVHRIVANEIGRSIKRNRLHEALATLAAAPGPTRMVTTNYDDFLHDALQAAHAEHLVFEAPALPLGNDFEGLVHLHGRLGQPPQRLVITDADFGTAYITRGWAPAFLRDLFSRFVVCFVGYSHDDRMMDYLAKGLPSDARQRYIITDRDEPAHWKQRKIVPICYPHRQHDVVVDLLAQWGAWAADTPFDRAQRVRALAAEAPPADPNAEDFLIASLEDRTLAAEVCQIATGRRWSAWMTKQRPFRALLGESLERPVDPGVLAAVARWAADAALSPDTLEAVYEAVIEGTGTIAPDFISQLLRRLAVGEVEPKHRSIWLRWAATAAPREHRALLQDFEMVWASDVVLSEPDTLLLLERLTGPWSMRKRPFYADAQTAELAVSGWELQEGVDRRLGNLEVAVRRELLTWLTGFFEAAHRRTASGGLSDPWSSLRWSISERSPEAAHGSFHAPSVLTDLARDSLAKAFEDDASYASSLRDLWLDSSAPLLQRLAIHSLSVCTDVSATDRIAAVMRRGLLFAHDVRDDIYALLAATAPELDAASLEALLDAVSQGPAVAEHVLWDDSEFAQQVRDHEVFRLFRWLQKHRPEMTQPKELEAIIGRHPSWVLEEQPSLGRPHRERARNSEDELPWPLEEFHKMLAVNAEAALSELELYTRSDRGYLWPVSDMLARTVQKWPDDGFKVWTATAESTIRERVLSGWGEAPLTEGQLDRVAALLLSSDLRRLSRAVARLLHPWTNDEALHDRWIKHRHGRELARRALAFSEPDDAHVAGRDPYASAISSTVGTLAEYWIEVAVVEARGGQHPGGGLSEQTAAALSDLVNQSDPSEHAVVPLLAQLDFLYAADPKWTQTNLLHRLDPASHSWPEIDPLWRVVLHGRISDELRDAGLRDWVLGCAASAGDNITTELAREAAWITVRSSIDDLTRLNWIARFVRSAVDPLVVSWTHEVARMTRDLTEDARTSLWKRWMRRHLERRVEGLPKKLTTTEATALLTWVAVLRESRDISEAVDILLRAEVGFGASSSLPAHLYIDKAGLHSAPGEWSRLIAGMLELTTSLEGHTAWSVRRMVRMLAEQGGDQEDLARIEQALYNLGHGTP